MLTGRKLGLLVGMSSAGLLVALAVGIKANRPAPHASFSSLSQSYVVVKPDKVLVIPPLIMASGQTFPASQMRGHWSVIFFGFTSCPLVCPKTLSLLTAVAHMPESGVPSGATQPIFVSIDPDRDSPGKVAGYLHHFDSHIVGLTGVPKDIRAFSEEVGAGYEGSGSTINHSTSLFVVNPQGQLAGIILRPSTPSRLLSDFKQIKTSAPTQPTG